MSEYVNVAVPIGVRKTFAYTVPPLLRAKVMVGSRVLVPFGRRWLTGFIVECLASPPPGMFKLRPIREVLDVQPIISGSLIETALWVAEHYFTPPGEVIRLLVPVGTEIRGTQKIHLAPDVQRLLSGGMRLPGMLPEQEVILELLARNGPMTVKELAARSGLKDMTSRIESLCAAQRIRLDADLRRPRVKEKSQQGIRVLPAERVALSRITERQRRLYECLPQNGEATILASVLREAQCDSSVAKSLVRRGLAEITQVPVERVPLELTPSDASMDHLLTAAQQKVFDELLEVLRAGRPMRYLLHGVTGSGKTEIYLRLIAEVLKLGGTALFLVPEIGLTPLLSRIAVARFPNQVSLLHSGLSAGERFDQWRRIRSGVLPVVVGTRSAVFAPVENLRFVILDEEQDSSYKQDEVPCYHAREVGWHRLQQSGGLLLMGSATPSIETYYAAVESREIGHLSLPDRIESRPLPDVSVVDMSLEFQRHGSSSVLSKALLDDLRQTLVRGEQAIILLNRRGFSRSLLCRSCGHVSTCRDCSIPLTYHQKEGHLICHYCGIQTGVPAQCEQCGGSYIYFIGVGTEQLEQLLRSLLPTARLARADRDSTRKRGVLRKILLDFSEGKLDVLLGTQMLAKGHDFPKVTLVGVLAADAGLSFPDFRSAERTFQLLTQVAGRAGRGTARGRVIIQSFYPNHYALQAAGKQDYCSFFKREIEFRKLLGYPPFRRLVQILIAHSDLSKATVISQKAGVALRQALRTQGKESSISLLGPAPAPIEKLRGKHRFQILLKCPDTNSALSILGSAFQELACGRVSLKSVQVDIDPLSLL
jgi:primosomal protein N' (replication factor Y)